MDHVRHTGTGARSGLRTALREAEGIGDVLCFLQLAMAMEGDMRLPHYARRGLAALLGDCSRRADRLCRVLDRILGGDDGEDALMSRDA